MQVIFITVWLVVVGVVQHSVRGQIKQEKLNHQLVADLKQQEADMKVAGLNQ